MWESRHEDWLARTGNCLLRWLGGIDLPCERERVERDANHWRQAEFHVMASELRYPPIVAHTHLQELDLSTTSERIETGTLNIGVGAARRIAKVLAGGIE